MSAVSVTDSANSVPVTAWILTAGSAAAARAAPAGTRPARANGTSAGTTEIAESGRVTSASANSCTGTGAVTRSKTTQRVITANTGYLDSAAAAACACTPPSVSRSRSGAFRTHSGADTGSSGASPTTVAGAVAVTHSVAESRYRYTAAFSAASDGCSRSRPVRG